MTYSLLLKQIFTPKKILRYVFVAGIPAMLFYGVSMAGLTTAGFSILEIVRDPAQQSGQSSLLGFLSSMGIWLWISSASICFFSILNYKLVNVDRYNELLFLVGMLSIILAIDDFFMIHDRYVNEKICFLAYAFCAGALLIRHFKQIIEIDGFSFLFAGSLLALSILTDLGQKYFSPEYYSYVQVIEEGFKFVGAATWLYFSCCIGLFYSSSLIEKK